MSNLIKIRLVTLGKTQVSLLNELHKIGYVKISPSYLSNIVTGKENGESAVAIRKKIMDILDKWESEVR